MSKKRLIVIVGPTASGKSDLAIRLSQQLGGVPILSADSRQFYRGMGIGSAQPSVEELQLAEHQFIAELDINQNFNCGAYETAALERLERLFAVHDAVIAVGGSGLYIRALCEGMDEMPQADEALRKKLTQRLETEGLEILSAELGRLDPEYYAVVDRNNPARVIRALEVCLQTGKPFSSFRRREERPRPFSIVKIGVEMPRDVLYERIDRRVDAMMEAGLEREARALYPFRRLNALQTLGYRELFDHFDGRCTLEEAVALIKRNSRRYAKRQLTWFRRDPKVRWLAPDNVKEVMKAIEAAGE